jgi:hypothetical protein
LRLRGHGENQVQHGGIESGCGKGQILDIALYRRKVKIADAGQGAAQHRRVEIKADVAPRRGQMWQIKPRANARQQHLAAAIGQGGQTAPPRRPRRPLQRRVVERGDQRVAGFQG